MPVWLAVALGGAFGSLARWQAIAMARQWWPSFPWGTLFVNVTGSFLIGLIWAATIERPMPDWIRIGLMTGIMGGYTTFSAFSLDTLVLWKDGIGPVLLNLLANVVLSLSACVAGALLVRQFPA